MKKPLITLTSKDFFTGIAPSAHAERGGLFFKADGVTPLYEAGANQSTLNGLLMAGASGTVVGGTPNGNFISSCVHATSTPRAYFGTTTGHIFSWLIDAGDTPPTGANLSDLHTATSKVTNLIWFQPSGGTEKLYYFQDAAIGDSDGFATWNDAGTFTSGGSTLNTAHTRPVHRFFGQILYGNSFGVIGSLSDDGASGVMNNTSALKIPATLIPTAISDDGTYACIGVTNNVTADSGVFADTQVIWWDGLSSSWQRSYPIPDPFIFEIRKTPIGVFAFGMTGIWQVTFSGVKKVYSRSPGLYSVSGSSVYHYGMNATSFFSNAVVWGGSSGSNSVIKSLGQLDISAPNATLHPFLTANKNITLVDGQILKGWLIVGDDTPQLVAYPFSTTNAPQTTVSAQTVYFQLPYETQITRIEVVFGVPLASGDAFNIQTKTDEATAAVTFDSCSFALNGAIRRDVFTPTLNPTPRANAQISFILNWTGGAVKIKSIHIFGEYELGKSE